MKVFDLDGDRDAVVGRVQVEGREYDVHAMPMARAAALTSATSVAAILEIVREVVPAMSTDVLAGLNAVQLRTIISLASQGSSTGTSLPFAGKRGTH